MPTQRRAFNRDEALTFFIQLDDRAKAVERGFTLRARLTSSAGEVSWSDEERAVKPNKGFLPRIEYKTTIALDAFQPDDYTLTLEAIDASGELLGSSRPMTFTLQSWP